MRMRAFDTSVLGCVRTRLAGLKRRRVQAREHKDRHASVLVPLCNVAGQASVLFTVRTSTLSTHAGQISFPGGHRDDGEDAEQAALRELHEELGLRCERSAILGLGHETLSITDVVVTPVVAFVGDFVSAEALVSGLTLSPSEVAHAFPLTLEHLEASAREEVLQRKNHTVVTKRYSALPGNDVWGLTAFILDHLMREVLRPCVSRATANL